MKSNPLFFALFFGLFLATSCSFAQNTEPKKDILRIDLAQAENAHLFAPGRELSAQLISGVHAGIIRPLRDSKTGERMSYEVFAQKVPEKLVKNFNRSEFHRIELVGKPGSKNCVLVLLRAAKFTETGKEEPVAFFLFSEACSNVFKDNTACLVKEPSTGREMFFDEVLERGLFQAE